MKTYSTGGRGRPDSPRQFRSPGPKTRTTPPPGKEGAAVLMFLGVLVLLGLSALFRYFSPDGSIQRPVDPNAPVIERPTFHEIH